MGRWIAIAALAVAGVGCTEGVEDACSNLCDEAASCADAGVTSDELAECQNQCLEAFGELPAECEDAAVEVVNCTASVVCNEDADFVGCLQGIEVPQTCEDAFVTTGDNCCDASNPCDWANDGVCDCGGTQAWDSADCGG